TDNPRLIKGTILEKLSEFERETVSFLDSHALMDTIEIIKYEGDSNALEEYLQRMRTVSPAERLAFLVKARQQRAKSDTPVADPLAQLQIEEVVTKEGRCKKKHDARIGIQILGKERSSAEGIIQPPPKKQKTKETSQAVGGVDKGKGHATTSTSTSQPPPSQVLTDASASPLSWDSFDPLEFISRGVTMVGDMTRFTNTSAEELRKKSLEYEVKGTLLNYLLSCRQEQEVLDAKNKMKAVDDNLAIIEKRYSETKAKLEGDTKSLKESQESEVERLKREYEDKLSKVKESYVASEAKLKENVVAQRRANLPADQGER
ncbi:hypothetical protein L195_g044308, partial [Trifolium pratense]